MAARPELFTGSLSPEMRKLLNGLDGLTSRLGQLTDRLEDSYPAPDPPAAPRKDITDD